MLLRVMVVLATMASATRAFLAAGKCPKALLGARSSPLRAMSSVTRPMNPNREPLTGERARWKKRKVALVVGYVGTGYYGLQFNQRMAHLPTIEGEIEDALFRAGHIAESNYRDLAKIGWSRSSRTDKGVHAARLVLNAKLLVSMMVLLLVLCPVELLVATDLLLHRRLTRSGSRRVATCLRWWSGSTRSCRIPFARSPVSG